MGEQYIQKQGDDKFYYKDPEKTILHRVDGPAFIATDGVYKEWWLNDKIHRTDGPAIEWANGAKEWFVNGVFIFEVDSNGDILRRILE